MCVTSYVLLVYWARRIGGDVKSTLCVRRQYIMRTCHNTDLPRERMGDKAPANVLQPENRRSRPGLPHPLTLINGPDISDSMLSVTGKILLFCLKQNGKQMVIY